MTDDGCREEVRYGGHLGPERGQRDWVDAMTKIIDKDAIPIALWNKGMKKLWSVEYHLTGRRQPDFVAISHVYVHSSSPFPPASLEIWRELISAC